MPRWYYIRGSDAFIPMPDSEPAVVDARNIHRVGRHSTVWRVDPESVYPMAWSRVWQRWIYTHHAVLGSPNLSPSPRQRALPNNQ
jgi:hypothetical protein